MRSLTVEIEGGVADRVIAPLGLTSPHGAVCALTVGGGQIEGTACEPELGLAAAVIRPGRGPLALHYAVAPAPDGTAYPEAAFRPRVTRHSLAAGPLADASRRIADAAGGGLAGIAALVAETEARFAYDHPDIRFTDGLDHVPHLTCGLTPGSCVDINTYLVASLRAAGFEAAYIYGYFFPMEKGGTTHDGHCWVVTRHDGQVQEWDIAHHLKAGLGPTRPAANPRPGERIALSHSMDHRYRVAGHTVALRILGEPMLLVSGRAEAVTLRASLSAPGLQPAGADA